MAEIAAPILPEIASANCGISISGSLFMNALDATDFVFLVNKSSPLDSAHHPRHSG